MEITNIASKTVLTASFTAETRDKLTKQQRRSYISAGILTSLWRHETSTICLAHYPDQAVIKTRFK